MTDTGRDLTCGVSGLSAGQRALDSSASPEDRPAADGATAARPAAAPDSDGERAGAGVADRPYHTVQRPFIAQTLQVLGGLLSPSGLQESRQREIRHLHAWMWTMSVRIIMQSDHRR